MNGPPDSGLESPGSRASGWGLRLLVGLQQGAEVPLLEGIDYVLGHDDACDLVIWDESVAPRHLAVRVADGRAQIRALDAPIGWTDRRLDPGESTEIESATALRLGETVLGLGPLATDWSRLAIPERMAETPPEPAPSEKQSSTPDVPERSSESGEFAGSPGPTPAPETDEPGPRTAECILQPDDSAEAAKRLWLSIAAVLSGLLILALLLTPWSPFGFTPTGDTAASAPDARDPSALEQARALVASLGLSGIEIQAQPNGTLSLHGYSPTRADRERLSSSLTAAGWRVDNRVWPEDQIREILAETLTRLGSARLHYDYLGQGEVLLRGWLRPGLMPEQVERLVQHDVPGVQRLQNELRPIAPVLEDLREQLRGARLERKLTIAAEAPPIRVSGRLDDRDMARWTAIRDALTERHPTSLPLETALVQESTATPAPMGTETVPAEPSPVARVSGTSIQVRGILIGSDGSAYALLHDGERVSVGDRIGGRYLIEEIRFDRVVALDGGERRIFRLGVKEHD